MFTVHPSAPSGNGRQRGDLTIPPTNRTAIGRELARTDVRPARHVVEITCRLGDLQSTRRVAHAPPLAVRLLTAAVADIAWPASHPPRPSSEGNDR